MNLCCGPDTSYGLCSIRRISDKSTVAVEIDFTWSFGFISVELVEALISLIMFEFSSCLLADSTMNLANDSFTVSLCSWVHENFCLCMVESLSGCSVLSSRNSLFVYCGLFIIRIPDPLSEAILFSFYLFLFPSEIVVLSLVAASNQSFQSLWLLKKIYCAIFGEYSAISSDDYFRHQAAIYEALRFQKVGRIPENLFPLDLDYRKAFFLSEVLVQGFREMTDTPYSID
ncbi:hypothetical protein Tco_1038277 [Tanacetum coccineum]